MRGKYAAKRKAKALADALNEANRPVPSAFMVENFAMARERISRETLRSRMSPSYLPARKS